MEVLPAVGGAGQREELALERQSGAHHRGALRGLVGGARQDPRVRVTPGALDGAIGCEHDGVTAVHAFDDTAAAHLDQDLTHARILSGVATVHPCER